MLDVIQAPPPPGNMHFNPKKTFSIAFWAVVYEDFMQFQQPCKLYLLLSQQAF